MGLESVYFFRSAEALPGVFDSLFGGLYLVKGIPLLAQLGLLLSFAASGIFAAASLKKPRPYFWLSAAFSLLCFFLICLFLLQPWDEVFINLRHSLNWARTGHFSFNAATWEEGTVDTLPYLLVGVLIRLGIHPVNAAFLMSFAGGLLCLFFSFRLLKNWGMKRALPFALLALCLYPPLAYNSAHGFATAVFAAIILASVDFLFWEKKTWVGLVLLSLLPLIRVEGIFFSVALVSVWSWKTRVGFVRFGAVTTLVTTPAVLHGVLRAYRYGEIVPLPVQYKSSMGSLFFLAVGIRNFFADAIATHWMSAAVALLFIYFFSRRGWLKVEPGRTQGLILAAIGTCTLAYYLSGGDWFPSYWARYLFPFCLFTILVFFSQLTRVTSAVALVFPALFFVISSLWPISSTWKGISDVFSHRRTLAMIHEPTIGRGHYRVQNLSRLGEHLRRTTLATDRIGTSELATIAFFADRHCIDYLGLINPEIAKAPLRPMPSLIRRFPYRSELPFLIFRRLNPQALERSQPEILYTFDFLIRDQLPQIRPYELTPAELFRALGRWHKQLGGLVDPLYGGIENIERLGYRPVVVQAGEDFTAMYFVHTSAFERHLMALKRSGFEGGEINCTRLGVPCPVAMAVRR